MMMTILIEESFYSGCGQRNTNCPIIEKSIAPNKRGLCHIWVNSISPSLSFSDDDDGDKYDQNKDKGWNLEKECDKEMKG